MRSRRAASTRSSSSATTGWWARSSSATARSCPALVAGVCARRRALAETGARSCSSRRRFDVPLRAPEQMPDDTQICDCNAVSKAQIVDAVLRGASSLQAVCDVTRAGTGCGSCRPEVERIIEMAVPGLAMPELLNRPRPRRPVTVARTPDEAQGRGDAEQDRAHQEGEGRARHRAGHPALAQGAGRRSAKATASG